ncbi:hypothetical protein [Azospirillum lipoferum]|uniref:DUF1612 domain-containing protein n=1 Tax=Azospirillum lipoferum (strain 4B) TaxID=862719 RepID=G7ZIT4_AZOL4|nr:hypothetical protein [Azospirillum lipoferum]CBS91632.1 conserved protein of unknown function [Azospirillum lipoferum 4B]
MFGISLSEKADPAVRAAAFERAALAVARLDATLDGHPLLPAWQHWVRLEAVRAHAGLDGHRVDPQRLAAYIEGLRLRVPDTPAHHERGADLDALSHALRLYGLMLAVADRRSGRPPDASTDAPEHRRLVEDALRALTQPSPGAHLPALARAMRAWLVEDRPRGAVRAALPAALQATGLTRGLLPILAGADTLRPDSPTDPDGWTLAFARSLEREAADGLAILRRLEHSWRAARAAIGPRRSNSRLPAAVDLLAATPLLGPVRLASLLGCSVRGAGMMLEDLVACGAAVEVTGRGSHRLYGLPGTEGIRGETAGPRRYGRRRGRPPKIMVPEPLAATEPPLPSSPAPARLDRLEVDYTALDALLADTDRVVERVQRMLKSR